MLARRRFLQFSSAAVASTLALPLLARAAAPATVPATPVNAAIAAAADFAALEKACSGRLGVTLLDSAGGRRLGHRQDERFPLCSTFKSVLAATVLKQAERDAALLDRRLPVRTQDLLEHAPVTRRHVGKDLTVRDLCRATLITSDNTAANLLFAAIGGPPAVTAFLRASGDTITRSDRLEPELNSFAIDDPRDTTTPAAIASTLQRLVLGNALRPASRQQLADWLIDNETGDACLRAGLGKRWRVGDKTGSNGEDARNDIAVLWPVQGGSPWVLTAYLQAGTISFEQRAAVLAQVGRIADGLIR
ncbi:MULTISPECIES: L2 family extended-spectrum class A beta-lactamase [Stenotrophomonas]|jgi:beta-lactamase class A|uniref:Beta-lactamase n=1 Tax=Stenotrophomonas indicatrix TaxID=2045451 RepID=A0ABT8QI21_9GAMM|nr:MULTISPECIES: L2 family extended-spectrum class A beta-lactamase [Stenotrophomonas]PJL08086.1 class A beta-lactamase [Stenotrophomonas maltophilia]MDH6332566.1 beta-lactamase class A [Stenotrophomonas sp. 1278]MDN8664373.1 L2 family extended-spectrum class A beta-lactamase [Stenotrophomonas indicatrix]MDN8671394.1 L2 family extended-spectrum class A beta-lactamase [Stenotrophomonas indicatrix]PII16904.1 class A beta-lactamase [Stenotrophomonas indicatrix]